MTSPFIWLCLFALFLGGIDASKKPSAAKADRIHSAAAAAAAAATATATAFAAAAAAVPLSLELSPPLPAPFQTNKRILAAITVAFQGRLHFLQRQLSHYVDACENGFEVHVVILSRVGGWEDTALLSSPGLFRCNRLQADLPIAVFNKPAEPSHLAFYHRPIFQSLQEKYDYFVSQEDDILISLTNLLYFTRHEAKLKGSGMLPTFAMFEIPHNFSVSEETKHKYPQLLHTWPRAWETSTWLLDTYGHVVRHHDSYYYIPIKSYCASYMIPRWVLAKYAQTPAWLQDEKKPWFEYNVHFAHQWLNLYFQMAMPISSWFSAAFVHHSPNRYINNIFTSKKPSLGPFNLSASAHPYALDADEYQQFLTSALGVTDSANAHSHPHLRGAVQPKQWSLNISYFTFNMGPVTDGGELPMQTCVNNYGKAARIQPSFHGKFPDCFYEKKADVKVKFQCVKLSDVPHQHAATCIKGKDCSAGFGPDVAMPLFYEGSH